jgi:hypothetical protein
MIKKTIIAIELIIIFILGIKLMDEALKKEEQMECAKIKSWIIPGAVVNPTLPAGCE